MKNEKPTSEEKPCSYENENNNLIEKLFDMENMEEHVVHMCVCSYSYFPSVVVPKKGSRKFQNSAKKELYENNRALTRQP